MKPHFCHVLLNFVWTPKEFHKIGCTCSSSLRLCVCVCVLLCFQHQDNANFVDQVGWNDLSLSLLWSCLRSNAFHDTVQLVGKIRHWLHWSWVVLVGRDCITLYILSMYWSLYMFCNILNLSLHPRYSSRKAADKNVCLITSSINVGLCFVTWEVSFRIVNTLEYQFAFCPRGCGVGHDSYLFLLCLSFQQLLSCLNDSGQEFVRVVCPFKWPALRFFDLCFNLYMSVYFQLFCVREDGSLEQVL